VSAVLKGVHLLIVRGVLTVHTTTTWATASATVNTPGGSGQALVPFAQLQRVISALPKGSGVTLEATGTDLTITGGNEGGEIVVHLPLMDLAAFLDIATHPAPTSVISRLSGLALADLGRATIAAGWDDCLPTLTAVELGSDHDGHSIVAAATDRYRLAVSSVLGDWAAQKPMLIPAGVLERAATEFRKDPQVTVLSDVDDTNLLANDPGRVTFTTGTRTLTATLTQGAFPKWRTLVPTETPRTINLARDATRTALTVCEAVTYRHSPFRIHLDPGKPLRFETGGHKLHDCQASSVNVPRATHTGFTAPTVIGLNPTYFRDGMSSLRGNDVLISASLPTRPIIMRDAVSDDAAKDEFFYLLMPVRIPA
jgi:DNA polymerase-3 subunit beta